MISPSMATMLCFITTDANVSSASLQLMLQETVEKSFNRITIDGDMSTNDSVIVLANGESGMPLIKRNSKECKQIREAMSHVMLKMAKSLVRDGERVTKFVTVEVKGAKTYHDAKKVGEAVANSALVKSSWNGNDPGLQAKTPMDTLCKAVSKDEFTITINLHQGSAEYEVYTSDLSPEYIDFNRSEYAYWKQARKDGLV